MIKKSVIQDESDNDEKVVPNRQISPDGVTTTITIDDICRLELLFHYYRIRIIVASISPTSYMHYY